MAAALSPHDWSKRVMHTVDRRRLAKGKQLARELEQVLLLALADSLQTADLALRDVEHRFLDGDLDLEYALETRRRVAEMSLNCSVAANGTLEEVERRFLRLKAMGWSDLDVRCRVTLAFARWAVTRNSTIVKAELGELDEAVAATSASVSFRREVRQTIERISNHRE